MRGIRANDSTLHDLLKQLVARLLKRTGRDDVYDASSTLPGHTMIEL